MLGCDFWKRRKWKQNWEEGKKSREVKIKENKKWDEKKETSMTAKLRRKKR